MSAAFILWGKHMSKLKVHSEEMFGMLIQPVLWVILFGLGMKGLVGMGAPGGDEYYIDFILPGIVALTALGGAIGGGVVWLNERTSGVVKEYLIAPIPRLSILMGNAMSIVTKSTIQAILIFIVGILLGVQIELNPLGWLGGLVLVTGFGIGFAGIALAVASKVDDPGGYHMLIFMLNLPLLFMSNALYPLESLPRWMEIGAQINPTSYVVDGIRAMVLEDGATMAGGETLSLWICFVVVAVFAILGMGLAYSVFRRVTK